MEFSRQEVLSAFRLIGEELLLRKKVVDLAVFGGVAIILQFDVSFVTHDIDAVFSDRDHGVFMDIVLRIARKNHWPTTWLNDAVTQYVGQDMRDHVEYYGGFPSDDRSGLRVYVAKPEYLLALKLKALRTGSRDVGDAVLLARHLGLTSLDELVEHLRTRFPEEPIDDRKIVAISLVAEQLSHDPTPKHP